MIITLSVMIQVGSFKLTGKRVFRMAPLQHHFELMGWAETTIVIRFWLIAGLFVALGLGLFYIEWLQWLPTVAAGFRRVPAGTGCLRGWPRGVRAARGAGARLARRRGHGG